MTIKKSYKEINNLLRNGFISGATYENVKKEIDQNYNWNKILKKIKDYK